MSMNEWMFVFSRFKTGQNGTSKSTILGMLGQPFGLRDRRTIFGRPFSTKFTDIFNMVTRARYPG